MKRTSFILIITALILAIFAACEIIPLEEAPHSNLLDPVCEEYTGTELSEAELSGTPSSTTYATSINITVGGEDVLTYKYDLDGSGYSEETEVSIPISVSNLGIGTHTLSVIGKNSKDLWQLKSRATTFSWEILEVTDTTPPSIINMSVLDQYQNGNLGVTLQWTAPEEQVLILRSTSSINTDTPEDRTQYSVGQNVSGCLVVYTGTASTIEDISFSSDGEYYYRAFAYDEFFNYANGGTEQSTSVFIDAVYVHFNGNDGNSGLSSSPLRTIQEGINKAVAIGFIYEVRVAGTADYMTTEKTYNTLTPATPLVSMISGISIYGGYDPADWSDRDPSTHVSRIFSQAVLTTGDSTIVLASSLSSAVTIDGFKIEGPNVTSGAIMTSTVLIDSCTGKVTISDCDIIGGNHADADLTLGINIDSSIVDIIGNRRIWGGNSTDTSGQTYGIYSQGSSAVTISDNDEGTDCIATAGAAGTGYAIYLYQGSDHIIENSTIRATKETATLAAGATIHIANCSAVVRNCRIESVLSNGSTANSIGIELTSMTSAKVYNNHILSSVDGTSGDAFAINVGTSHFELYNNNICAGPCGTYNTSHALHMFISDSYDISVENNNIYTSTAGGSERCGIYEAVSCTIDSFGANNFIGDFSGGGLYYDSGTGYLSSLSAVNSLPKTASNIIETLTFDDDGMTTDGSSFMTAGIDGAADGWGFSTDKGGTTRTGNGTSEWSIGPYEYD